ncbi:ABC transporter permease [Halococcus morrhuae DSM 1307]|uniref:ABC transporter permease n=1 Tax=Halococcus dombrowskii TaxID=179637 RepID=A0AAV3SF69_HALDO|nr:ABC transporter permease [Halococcus dombrowskii]UOO95024.1 ABC transporter permease [Halococcus dombrowskii]
MSTGSASVRERLVGRYGWIADQLRFLAGDRLALGGVIVIALFGFLGLFGPLLAPHDPVAYSARTASGSIAVLEAPNLDSWFGTTAFGKDVFSQFLAGARPTLIVGLVGGIGTGVIGFLVGLTSGYFGGYVDELLMRLTDLTFSLPLTPMALLLLTFVRPNVWLIALIIMLFLWKMPARVVRSEVLAVKNRTFVRSARASGAGHLRTMFYHIAPNVLATGFLYTAYGIAWSISLQASLAFLGFGDPTATSWGRMLRQVFASGAIRVAWWWVLPPAIGIAAVTTSVFLIGRRYEERINPEITASQ